MKKTTLFVFLLAGLCQGVACATVLLPWQRLPLPVPLHTGHERVVFVNRNVRVGYPAALDGKLRIQSSGGSVYLLAKDDFPRTRLQLVDMDSGALILLDISASAGDELEPVEIRYDTPVWRNDMPGTTQEASDAEPEPHTTDTRKAALPAPLPVVLTRYAAQRLYGPPRVVEAVPGIAAVPVRLPATVTTLIPTQPVQVTPLAAWRAGEMTVTALKLQNRAAHRVTLDPRWLQGQFVAATFQHAWLGEQGTPEDTTVVYLVTEGRADRAMIPEPEQAGAVKNTGGH